MTGQALRGLDAALRRAAAAPVLLVGIDFDGTLAPIVDDPMAARALPAGKRAVEDLASLPGVQVVVVSGRSLEDLARLGGFGDEVHLVGGHGAESRGPHLQAAAADPAAAELLERLRRDVAALTDGVAGVFVEEKPASVAVHVRNVEPGAADKLTDAVLEGPARLPGVRVLHGKKVVELLVVEATKGSALRALRRSTGAACVVYLGDDVTDEEAFAVLGDGDVGVKVGPGRTAADYRVDDPARVATLLQELGELRRA